MFLTNIIKSNKNNFLLLLFLSILAISLFSPIASSRYLPTSPDFPAHIGAIIQAKMAIDAGQFPLRVAPWQFHGFQYPFYQLYSPFVYTVAGVIYKTFSPHNPFIAFKITIWLFMVLGGFYFFRLINMLVESKPIALVSSVVYMMAPYYLININVRGDLTESVAQGIIPIVLFYIFSNYVKDIRLYRFILLSIAWCCLLLSHLVTFVYTSIFIFLLFAILCVTNPRQYKKLFFLGISYLISILLAAWFLIPILYVHNYLYIASELGNPFYNNWLTPLATLLSSSAVSPMPMPGNNLLPFRLYAAAGWPILIGVGVVFYNIVNTTSKSFIKNNDLIFPLLIMFFIAFFFTWSPVNFWKYLPKEIVIAQFSYRFLTQMMWIGTILFAYAFVFIFRSSKDNFKSIELSEMEEQKYIFIILLLIAALTSSWLHTDKSSGMVVKDVIHNPDIGYGAPSYLVDPGKVKLSTKSDVFLDSVTADGWLKLNTPKNYSTTLLKNLPNLTINLKGNVPSFYQKILEFYVFINNEKVLKYKLNPGEVRLEIPIYKYIDLQQKNFLLSFGVNHPFVPRNITPGSTDSRILALTVSEIYFLGNKEHAYIPVDIFKKNCHQNRNQTLCKFNSESKLATVQLPTLYYPKLLMIKVNGKSVNYFPSVAHGFLMATIELNPGLNSIRIALTGIGWANLISAIMSILIIFSLVGTVAYSLILKLNK